jgi:hypothetical protein
MNYVAPIVRTLERESQIHSVEAFSKVLEPSWTQAAVLEGGVRSLRRRLFPADVTAWIVILLALFRRLSYEGLLEKLADSNWQGARWAADALPSSSALSRARDRLGIQALTLLDRRTREAWLEKALARRIGTHRALALDGFCGKVEDTAKNRERFGLPASTRGRTGHPQVRVVAAFDVATRLVVAHREGPFRVGEITLASGLVGDLPRNCCVVMDRGFYGKKLLWALTQGGTQFVVRLKGCVRPRRMKKFGRGDYLVALSGRPDMNPGLPSRWRLREVTYRPPGSSTRIRLLTSLLDPLSVPAAELAALYHDRWQSETSTGEIKTQQCGCAVVSRPTLLRSKTPARVEQEILALFIAYNLVRTLMAESAQAGGLAPRRLSFSACLERTKDALWQMMALPSLELLARYEQLCRALRRRPVVSRPGRSHPRAVKTKMSKYPVRRRPADC